MKTYLLTLTLLLVLSAARVSAQTVTLFIGGQVTTTPSGTPWPDHLVFVNAYPDSLNPSTYVRDSATTNPNGVYSFTLTIPWVAGTAVPFSVSTYDCQSNLHQQYFWYSGNSTQFSANFSLCDTFPPPASCENYQLSTNLGNYLMSLHGALYNPQPASYSWNFGDGTTATGADIIHQYPGPGVYFTTLTTITEDSCMNVSYAYYGFNDSIPPSPCENSISVTDIQGLLVSLSGSVVNQQTAVYTWEFGDGASASGSVVSHLYPITGVYNITLRTITNDSCNAVSMHTLTLLDSIVPSGCDNYISVTGTQGLTVSLNGGLYNQNGATFAWSFGDGSAGSGPFVTHTYAFPGTYAVSLTTITADSCVDVTTTNITLIDSIPNGCNSYFTASAGNNLYEIYFEGFTSSQYPSDFNWDFGDGTTATGYNVQHTYSVQGTYTVGLSTTDSTGCSYTFVSTVTVGMNTIYSIYGQVFAQNQSITACKVQLFSQDPAGSMTMVQEVFPDSANYYTFPNVNSGIYRILAIPLPGTVYAQQYLPTYFGDAYMWEEATPVVLGQPLNPYHINLVSFDSISGGSGLINGELNAGGKSMSAGNQEILILDNANNPVKYMFSEADGTFSFAGLPYGEYFVYPVITGVTTYPVTVVLSAENSTVTVIMTINGQTIAAVNESDRINLVESIYPNPATDYVLVSVKVTGSAKIRIMDISGRILWAGNETNIQSEKLVRIPVSELKPGMYLLMVADEKGNSSSRMFLKN